MPETVDQARVDPAKALELCLKETECVIYHSDNIEPPCTHDSKHCPACVCHGTSRVPLLDQKLVRIECKEWHSYGSHPDRPRLSCVEAGCRGWVPSIDPWDYVRAAWQRTDLPVQVCADIMAAIKMALDHNEDPGLAAFDVVWGALVGKERL